MKPLPILGALLVAALAALTLVPAHEARAQTCPPGQTIIGMTGGGNGIAPQPICGGDGSGNESGPAPGPNFGYTPVPPPDLFGAYVIETGGGLYWASQRASLDEAEAAAMATCHKANGKDCRRLQRFGNQCIAYAVDADGMKLHMGLADYSMTAEQAAMDRCNAENPTRTCKLMGLGVCAGPQFPETINQRAANATREEVDAASRAIDNKHPDPSAAGNP
ncbi:DUF4189 domain-containing protein [Sphingopyxis panaciterrae]